MTHSRRDIVELLESHGLSPRRAFGQNFVADPNTVRRISRLADVGPADHVVEIGAGLGSLTLALAETGARVTAIEVDHGVAPVLRDVVSRSEHADHIHVIEDDARHVDWSTLEPRDTPLTVVANLPYNVATPLVADLLDDVPRIRRFVVMVQKEVAQRLAARPGSSDFGGISVKVSYWATARLLGDVPPTVFVPRPKVTSAIIEIVRRDEPAVASDRSMLFDLVRTAFGKRRKMLRRSLHGVVSDDQFAAAAIDPTRRPEELSVVDWGRLTDAVTRRDS
ncbi:MAG: 16S rRNA (adenine(1518)-N(6)/adenine(1519)-N(6))-dimethyltransferase RsmA [Actinomycetota bacterium]|nr:16S rRNA (adenine(1518)-N(6)/adenine(1519)-N(6))-dimethyltransferase RsmA [Actinomycetota bacterium]MDA2971575.1 16S rRNA (adenine(1518)-N(6)/adenine(1519)-N(6))-dimethyltransferase RsmA [Actinomycetota bacterium]MDA3000491.1 16S rRNA (adenine(1518)-N(6)/adenine(1519)-N(6))-dimethyltransferase RsmA [Actinomycetota bacterium]